MSASWPLPILPFEQPSRARQALGGRAESHPSIGRESRKSHCDASVSSSAPLHSPSFPIAQRSTKLRRRWLR